MGIDCCTTCNEYHCRNGAVTDNVTNSKLTITIKTDMQGETKLGKTERRGPIGEKDRPISRSCVGLRDAPEPLVTREIPRYGGPFPSAPARSQAWQV